eukprot:gb/GFBE01030868.1/.p1 GENE.gb/GFBE01030868.1/~~gb/GFBE01030868.1/.p1  ORF type:complete len:384 (+),score=108.00 gb/GFBE01030868.1/:1-1152(+)
MKFAARSVLVAMFGTVTAYKMSKSVRILGTEITAAGEPQQALLSLVASAAHATDDSVPDVGALTNLAQALSKSKADDATVTQIRTLVDGMLASLTDQHAATQAGLGNMTQFDRCDAKKETDLAAAQGMDDTGEWANTTTQYNACMRELETLNATWQTCLGVQRDLEETKLARCRLFEAVDKGDAYAEWFCTGDQMDSTASYKTYLQRNIDMLHDYEVKRDNCTTATTAYEAKVAECSVHAGPVSDKVLICANLKPGTVPVNCGPKHASAAACNSYDLCWTAAETSAAHDLNTAQALETSLMAEWRSLKRIQCLLDVLGLTDGATQTTKLQECIDKTHSAAAMDIVEPTYPTKGECEIFPCSNETAAEGGEEADANAGFADPTR